MAAVKSPHPIKHRHPELVSGPISRFTRCKRWQTQPHRQVRPVRVVLVDQIDLPLPMPTFQLLLTEDRRFHRAEQLEVNQRVDGVLRGEAGQGVVAMLPKARDEIGSNADVNRSVGLARKNVDARLALLSHAPECAARWVLKQVQDDEKRKEEIKRSHFSLQSRHPELVSGSISPFTRSVV